MISKNLTLFALFLLILISATPLFAVDSDGDALSDDVEAQLGSSPLHKDIFVEVDWLVVNGRSMKPRGNFAQIVKSTFANAPVSNPDGTNGINLHIQMSEGIPVTDGRAIVGDWDSFDWIKILNFTSSSWDTHHYCLFIDAIFLPDGSATISGISRNRQNIKLGASDFVIAMGPSSGFFNYPTAADYKWSQVGTFIHELGHNLGLKHGNTDNLSYKPNNLSVMSYAYQMLGIPITYDDGSKYYIYDYARVSGAPISENSVNEFNGIGTGQQIRWPGIVYGARWCFGPGSENCWEVFDSTGGVDFNIDGKLNSGYKLDLNQDQRTGMLSPGKFEWAGLTFDGGWLGKSLKSNAILPRQTTLTCLTSNELPKRIYMDPTAKRGTTIPKR